MVNFSRLSVTHPCFSWHLCSARYTLTIESDTIDVFWLFFLGFDFFLSSIRFHVSFKIHCSLRDPLRLPIVISAAFVTADLKFYHFSLISLLILRASNWFETSTQYCWDSSGSFSFEVSRWCLLWNLNNL